MKLQIDTTEKTIKVLEDIPLGELLSAIKKLLPEDEWEKYKLQTNIYQYQPYYPVLTPYAPTWTYYPSYTTGIEVNQ